MVRRLQKIGERRTAAESTPLNAATFALMVVSFVLFSSCGAGSRDGRVILAIDEAFAEARPVLAMVLAGDARLGGNKGYRPLSLAEGPSRALAEASATRDRLKKTAILVASPLVAATLIGAGSWKGDPVLVVPEWRGTSAKGLRVAYSDPLPAYALAGAICGAYVATFAAEGGSPSCGIVFSPAPSRPRSALEAFTAAFAERAEGKTLVVRELPASTDEPSADASAEIAVAELLGSDLRILFAALGSATPAALRAAARPGITMGADYPLPLSPASLAFRIVPDERGLAAALNVLATASLGSLDGAKKEGAEAIAVPCRLEALPAASTRSAGGHELSPIIEAERDRARRVRPRRRRSPAPLDGERPAQALIPHRFSGE